VRKPQATEQEMIGAARAMLDPPTRDEVKAARAAARSGAIVNWNDLRDADPKDPYAAAAAAGIDPRDLYEAAAVLMTACVDEPDGREVWLILAPNVREIIRSALRLGPPKQRGRPKQKKGQRSNQARRSNLMKKRQIVSVVAAICERYGLNPTRNPLSRGTLTGCSIVASALGKSERQIERIYGENKPS
jgi:hypothetical protein